MACSAVNVDAYKTIDKLIVLFFENLQDLSVRRVCLLLFCQVDIVFTGLLGEVEDERELKSLPNLILLESCKVECESLHVKDEYVWQLRENVLSA